MTHMNANHFDREEHPEHVERALDDAVTHLAEYFSEFDRDLVRTIVRNSYASLGRKAAVHQHLVTLAEHAAWQRLHDMRAASAA